MNNTRVEKIDISKIPHKKVLFLLENVQILTKLSLNYMIPFAIESINKDCLKINRNTYYGENIYSKMIYRYNLNILLNIVEEDILIFFNYEESDWSSILDDEIMLEYENYNDLNYNKKKKKYLKRKYEFLVYNNFPINQYTSISFIIFNRKNI